jgi:rare lipoprotein A
MILVSRKILKLARCALAALLLTQLIGCVSLKSRADVDGPPVFPRSVKNIPDAIPKHEPKSKYGNPSTYSALGKTYRVLDSHHGFEQTGMASWYGTKFHGKRTSSGEPYDMYAMTAAHPTLPIPCYAKVTNLQNGKMAIVKINDRGPFKSSRVMDLSYAAAHKLGVYQNGTSKIKLEVINPAEWDHDLYLAEAKKQPFANLAKTTPKKEIKSTETPGVYLQLAAFSQKRNAHAFADKIQGLVQSHPIEVKLADTPTASSTYRVRVGPFAKKQDANQVASLLKSKNLTAQISEVF